MSPIIQLDKVSKSFDVPIKGQKALRRLFWRRNQIVEVLKEISFSIEAGEFVGYIGPNGAGKSTTIKLLTGILYPSSGSVSVLGYNPHGQRYKYTYNIGVVFGQRSLLEYDIPVIDSLNLYRAIYEVEPAKYRKRLDEFCQILELDKLLHIPVRKLSLGQRMRCEIAASLLHEPKVIFLDEPTIGLDALSKEEIRKFLRRMNEQENITIILTTHDMDDIEELCKRIIFIDEGNLIYDGSLETLRNNYASHKNVEISYKDNARPPAVADVEPKLVSGYTWSYAIPRAETAELLPELLKTGQIKDISIHEPRLEEIVKKIYSLQRQKPTPSPESL